MTVFQVPHSHLLPRLLSIDCGLKPLFDAPDAAARRRLVGPLSASRFDVRAQLAAFAPFFNPHYLPVRSAKTRSHFCEAEDDLLGLGLERYGMENLNVVRAMLMPCKSVTQLEHRVSNMTRRAKPDNPIKRAKERLEAEGMLSIAEEVVLEQGVLHLGTDWAAIRAEYLPHRDEAQLRHTWDQKLCPAAKDRASARELPIPMQPPVFGVRAEPATANPGGAGAGAGASSALVPRRAPNGEGGGGGAAVEPMEPAARVPSISAALLVTGPIDADEIQMSDSDDDD